MTDEAGIGHRDTEVTGGMGKLRGKRALALVCRGTLCLRREKTCKTKPICGWAELGLSDGGERGYGDKRGSRARAKRTQFGAEGSGVCEKQSQFVALRLLRRPRRGPVRRTAARSGCASGLAMT
jgi:hypothetical protein